jgi:7,8-dihydropterin-6-yl-methyl-4-(beta-D-ribofuranosyl)aminobenzene 5'-phosphate synthase
MRISILTDNHAGSFTKAEHGLSYLIESDGKRILFDTGQSDIFLRNAEVMDISIRNIDIVILSHGHFDHGNGLEYLKGGRLICHPGCFERRYRRKDGFYIGLRDTKDVLCRKFELITSSEPYEISKKIFFLGEIPRLTDFESNSTSFVFENGIPDYVSDDSAVTFMLPEGLFVVTGCGHSGIVNTLEYSKRITGVTNLLGIMGGFHLKETDLQLKETIKYLKTNRIRHIYPSHCTELPALSSFYDNFRIRQVKTGDVLEF